VPRVVPRQAVSNRQRAAEGAKTMTDHGFVHGRVKGSRRNCQSARAWSRPLPHPVRLMTNGSHGEGLHSYETPGQEKLEGFPLSGGRSPSQMRGRLGSNPQTSRSPLGESDASPPLLREPPSCRSRARGWAPALSEDHDAASRPGRRFAPGVLRGRRMKDHPGGPTRAG